MIHVGHHTQNKSTFKIHLFTDMNKFIIVDAAPAFHDAFTDEYRQVMAASLQSSNFPEDMSFVLFYPLKTRRMIYFLSVHITLHSKSADAFEYTCMEICSPFKNPESMFVCIDPNDRIAEMHSNEGVQLLKYDDVTDSEAQIIAMTAYGAHESEMAMIIGCTASNIKYMKKQLCKKYRVHSMQQLLLVNLFLKLSPMAK